MARAIRSHIGDFLREWVFPEGESVSRSAERPRVSRQSLSAVLNGRAGLSPELALKVEKVFGVDAATMIRMQAQYDYEKAAARADEITAGLEPAA